MKINLATGFCVASFALTTSIVACGPSAAPTDGATKTGPTPTNEPPRSDPPSSSDPAPSVVLDSADAGPLDASADAAFPDPQCGSLARSACVTCCNIAYAAMADAFRSTLANCVCTDPGECASDCGSNYCAGMSASPA